MGRTGVTPKYTDKVGGNIRCEHIPQSDSYPADVPRPAYLSHVVLQTMDVPKLANWWRTVLGGRSTVQLDHYAIVGMNDQELRFDGDFITFDGEHHRIAIVRVGPTADFDATTDVAPQESSQAARNLPRGTGLAHIAFTYASLHDLIVTYRRLKAAGIEPIRMLHHGPTVSNYYQDPDGNNVELQINAFPTIRELDDWFVAGNFDSNPIGLTYDFEDLAKRFDAGEDPDWLASPDGYIKQHAFAQQ